MEDREVRNKELISDIFFPLESSFNNGVVKHVEQFVAEHHIRSDVLEWSEECDNVLLLEFMDLVL